MTYIVITLLLYWMAAMIGSKIAMGVVMWITFVFLVVVKSLGENLRNP